MWLVLEPGYGAVADGRADEIELSDGKQIAVVIGAPPSEIPTEYMGEG